MKKAILTLDLLPGEPISEAELSASLGLSRTPVHEAISLLRMEGFVTMDSRSGFRIAPVTLRDVRELYELRACIEGEAVALAAVKSTDDVERLRGLDELCRSSYDPDDPDSITMFLERNTSFHVALASLSDNERLTAALRSVMEQLERVCQLTLAARRARPEDWVHEHTDLLGAVMSGDAEEARRIAVTSLRESHRRAREVLTAADVIADTNLGDIRRSARDG